jgi:tetratricopeptide (TPR) repeat protein
MKQSQIAKWFSLIVLFFTFITTSTAQEAIKEENIIQRGINLYKAGRYEEAIDMFSEVLKRSTIKQENIDASIYLGLTYFSLQRQEEGRKSIEAAIQLKPDLTLEEKDIITLEFTKFFTECKNNIVGIGFIESIPSGALVYLDKQKVGITPLKLELLSQKYYLRVVKPWYDPIEDELEIEKSIVTPVKLDMTKGKNWKTFLRSSVIMAAVTFIFGFL